MSSLPPTKAAFFGATGGCANSCLTHSLKAGYNVIALARTPSKLTTQLLAQDLSQETIDRHLTIVKGDVTDVAAVKETLLPKKDGALVPAIIFGIGSVPKFQASLRTPISVESPEVCHTGTVTIQTALREIYTENSEFKSTKPLLTFISTTGIPKNNKNDVPFGFGLFYHVALAVPHADKRKMEDEITSNMAKPEEDARDFRGYIGVRPSLLAGNNSIKTGKGWKTLKVGTEEDPAVGYTIQRADVGEWIFEEVIRRGGDIWVGKMVTLTS